MPSRETIDRYLHLPWENLAARNSTGFSGFSLNTACIACDNLASPQLTTCSQHGSSDKKVALKINCQLKG
eukprot:6178968-Amphidinium_carterae.1